jgi:hypothetical protein
VSGLFTSKLEGHSLSGLDVGRGEHSPRSAPQSGARPAPEPGTRAAAAMAGGPWGSGRTGRRQPPGLKPNLLLNGSNVCCDDNTFEPAVEYVVVFPFLLVYVRLRLGL